MLKFKRVMALSLVALLIAGSSTKFSTKVFGSVEAEKISEEVLFINDNNTKNAVDFLKNDKFASLEMQQDYLNKNYIKLNYVDRDSLVKEKVDKNAKASYAFDMDNLKADSKLREKVKELSDNGKMIYLYGQGITLKEYDELLGLDGVGIFSASETGALKDSSLGYQKLGLVDGIKYNIIGFKQGEPNSLYVSEIGTYDDNNKKINNQIENFKLTNGVLEAQVTKVNDKLHNRKDKSITLGDIKIPFLEKSSVFADSQYVTSSPHSAKSFYDVSNRLVGKIDTSWYLMRDLDETDSTYDYFTVQVQYEILAGTYYKANSADIKHSLPYSSDAVNDWGPKDNSGASISVSIPWGVSYTTDTSNSLAVDECGSMANDYGRWIISPRWYQNSISYDGNDPCRFRPGTAWLSTGTYAGLDSDISITYETKDGWNIDRVMSQTVNVRYDY